MMTTYTNEQIMANRLLWIDFLKLPGIKKGQGWLDLGNGERCCLGHGCFILGLEVDEVEGTKLLQYGGMSIFAPNSFVEMVGLYDNEGSISDGVDYDTRTYYSLASWNDDSEVTPQEIGAYLESVIDGGENSPFKKLI